MLLAGCSSLRVGLRGALASEKATLASRATGAQLALNLPTRVFHASDAGVAEFFLTDLPAEVLASGGDLSRRSATIVHIHQIVTPSAGSTPIADSATNALVRVLVLHEGVAGLYAGGGFSTPTLGANAGVCTVRGATLALHASTNGFRDALGAADFATSFSASRNDALANNIRRALLAVEAQLNEPTASLQSQTHARR